MYWQALLGIRVWEEQEGRRTEEENERVWGGKMVRDERKEMRPGQ